MWLLGVVILAISSEQTEFISVVLSLRIWQPRKPGSSYLRGQDPGLRGCVYGGFKLLNWYSFIYITYSWRNTQSLLKPLDKDRIFWIGDFRICLRITQDIFFSPMPNLFCRLNHHLNIIKMCYIIITSTQTDWKRKARVTDFKQHNLYSQDRASSSKNWRFLIVYIVLVHLEITYNFLQQFCISVYPQEICIISYHKIPPVIA